MAFSGSDRLLLVPTERIEAEGRLSKRRLRYSAVASFLAVVLFPSAPMQHADQGISSTLNRTQSSLPFVKMRLIFRIAVLARPTRSIYFD